MNTLTLTQLVSISELQRDYPSLVEKVKKLAVPFFLLKRNEPEAVLLSLPVYEAMVENNRLYEEKMAMEAIEDFDKEKKKGKLLVAKNAEDLFK
ncbi:type II toxin-antitoxin system Phd/YefM family antitoxin [Candidatus Parcubacteria bacterium]|nr:type II toxin-antitoxin system Phd/YefM family antitoxin [Patescibacteria group bacterium]MBU4381031.1 type II toxin-antitoxin system Phd/YefM family antitoxin [Patescibacteria group bacterium]MCG2689066.1 type II toxin-antitoxin system Phd/YefM family antitoxin [Candidatus Parcubacteria bacterium]